MATTIVTKNSSTASAVPTAGQLVQGELAVNVADKRLYTENASGVIVEVGTNPSTIDINSGTIDGTVIGGSTAAAGGFTSLTATSANVNGTVTADGLSVDGLATIGVGGSTNQATELRLNGTSNAGNGAYLRGQRDGSSAFLIGDTAGALGSGTGFINYVYDSNPWIVYTNANERLTVEGNGDISFYEDTGTTAKLFWDASAESLGIGTSSPATDLHIKNAGSTQLLLESGNTDTGFLLFGDAQDSNIGSLSYNHSDNSMRFETDDSERMRIDSSGNVGIGLTNPSSYYSSSLVVNAPAEDGITIVSPSNSTGYLMFADGTSGSQAYEGYIAYNHLDNYLHFRANDYMKLETNSAERMRIDSSGNVGIGTSTPSGSKLQVQGDGVGIKLDGTANTTRSIFFRNTTSSNPAQIYSDGSLRLYTEDAGTDIRFHTVSNGTNNERMRIDSSGNLLVGTTNNYGKLSVYNALGSSAGINHDPAAGTYPRCSGIGFGAGSTSYSVSSGGGTVLFHGGAGIYAENTASSGNPTNLVFWTNAAGSPAESMRIDASGNLLLGTTSGSDRLNVYQAAGGTICTLQSAGTAGAYALQFKNPNGAVGNVTISGSSTSYNTSSDQRLKENIADADDAGSKIDAIQVRQYDWKADGSHQDYGMIAQELQLVAPEAVSGDADSEKMMGVDYSKLVPMLIKEIQSLRNRVAQLEA
jgi:hypothetical protein